VDLAVSTSDDGNVTGDTAQFETYGAGNIQRAVEAAGNGGAHLAASERHNESEQRDWCGQLVVSRHPFLQRRERRFFRLL
jgi:hypothetical protein